MRGWTEGTKPAPTITATIKKPQRWPHRPSSNHQRVWQQQQQQHQQSPPLGEDMSEDFFRRDLDENFDVATADHHTSTSSRKSGKHPTLPSSLRSLRWTYFMALGCGLSCMLQVSTILHFHHHLAHSPRHPIPDPQLQQQHSLSALSAPISDGANQQEPLRSNSRARPWPVMVVIDFPLVFSSVKVLHDSNATQQQHSQQRQERRQLLLSTSPSLLSMIASDSMAGVTSFALPMPLPHHDKKKSIPDFGGLRGQYQTQRLMWERTIRFDDVWQAAQHHTTQLDLLDHNNTDPRGDHMYFFEELSQPQRCSRPQWAYRYAPVCNTFHETVLDSPLAPSPLRHSQWTQGGGPTTTATTFVVDNKRLRQDADTSTPTSTEQAGQEVESRRRRDDDDYVNQDDENINHPRRSDTLPLYNITYLGHGYYRYAWLYREVLSGQRYDDDDVISGLANSLNKDDKRVSPLDFDPTKVPSHHEDHDQNVEFVLKRYRIQRDIHSRAMWLNRMEATVMEALTSSPRIGNIYGHCALSIMVEPAMDLATQTIPRLSRHEPYHQTMWGRIDASVLKKLEEQQPDGVLSMNHWSDAEKLEIAIAMAESLAEMHGYPGGVLVNDDLSPEQWLITRTGRVILNDMNNAKALKWHHREQRYCHEYSVFSGEFKAPEEYGEGGYIDESVDIWPMGNLIFTLLTGLLPYYEYQDWDLIQKITIQGIPPYLNPVYGGPNRSVIEQRLVGVMRQCYQYDPTKRPSIFHVVKQLHETKILAHINQQQNIID